MHELNKTIAERIFGISNIFHIEGNGWYYTEPGRDAFLCLPDYSENARDSFLILDHMKSQGWNILLNYYQGYGWIACFMKGELHTDEDGSGFCETPEEAICKGALKALEIS